MAQVRILVAGARGQLARALVGAARTRPGIQLIALGRPQLDLSDSAAPAAAIRRAGPHLIVNAAAYTAVDQAEREPDAAFTINRDGAGALAGAAAAAGVPIIHVSTDYVFDGTKPAPYVETDPANPLSAYGRSKLEGEIAVAAANPRHIVLRTAWLYTAHGRNFLTTMLRLARERPRLEVVDDQLGNPTYAPHLAGAILAMAERLANARDAEVWGTYHAAAGGETTWHGFASAMVERTARLGVPPVPVVPITSADYPTVARRPANSRLDSGKLERVLSLRLPPWQEGLEECIARLEADVARA